MFWFLGCEACGILAPQPGVEPAPLALEGEILTSGPVEKSLQLMFLSVIKCPGGSDGNESACNAGDSGSVPGLCRSPGEGNGNPLQYSCLENPMDRGAWWAMVHGVAKSQTHLSD